MPSSLLLACLLALMICTRVHANSCTDACDALFPISPDMVNICGTDGENHTVPVAALAGLPPPWACYRDCNVGVLYPGYCGCPNDCNSGIGRGNCTGTSGCSCAPGWGGADCSVLECPNSCGGKGKCVSGSNGDECMCWPGYTGVDCSIQAMDIPVLPYGEVLPGKYWYDDPYGDYHPVFNLSVIMNINIEMAPSDYLAMLLPSNTWNQSDWHVQANFSNGIISGSFPKASIKIKGDHGRLCAKKSFILEFDHKQKNVPMFYGLSEIALKAPSFDLSYVHNQIIVEYYRAMQVPVSRGSFGTLTINGIWMGLFWLNEELKEIFTLGRFGTDGGNLYQNNDYLVFYGDSGDEYKNATKETNGYAMQAYELQFGNGTYTDLAALSVFLNESSYETFYERIPKILNVDNFIRSMVVESAIDFVDGFTGYGDNWALYDCPTNNSWQFISHDYEWTFLNPLNNAYDVVEDNVHTLIASRLFNYTEFIEIFNDYYKVFLNEIFDPNLKNGAIYRIEAMHPFLAPLITQDQWYAITNGIFSDEITWVAALDAAENFIDVRWAFLKVEFFL